MRSYNRKKTIILVVLGLGFVLVPTVAYIVNLEIGYSVKNSEYRENITLDKESLRISKASGIIHINDNWTDAKNELICTGNGTYSEPYVIEDLVIDAGGSGSGILIENSEVYFKIENNTVYNSGGSDAGIRLYYVDKGKLVDNNCSSNNFGIILDESNNNTVSGNTVNNNSYGIGLLYSCKNTISGNIASNNDGGIYLQESNSSTVSENNANNNEWNGISLWSSHNNTISGNNASYNGCGIGLSGGQLMGLSGGSNSNIISGNNASNNGCGISIAKSDNNTISGNIANNSNDGNGIHLWQSDNNTISGNIVNYNNCYYLDSWYEDTPASGIFISNCDNNRIIFNILSNNKIGISIYYSRCNIISDNSFSGNDENIRGTQEECNPLTIGIGIPIVITIVGITMFITVMIIYKRKKNRGTEIKYLKKEFD